MSTKNTPSKRAVIRQAVLSMRVPFNMTDMFWLMRTKHGIQDRQLIINVTEELCESGVVRYSELDGGQFGFEVVHRLPIYASPPA